MIRHAAHARLAYCYLMGFSDTKTTKMGNKISRG